jgi:hypothetical protein
MESIPGLLKNLQIRAQAPLASGIGSLEWIPGLLKHLQIRAQATLVSGIGFLESILGSLNVYKYGLRLHWLAELVPWNRFLGSIT